MARVSIFYDEDLKEQFFMVRGDESYARATKTILEVGASTPNLYDFDLSVTVNVLRDDGDGTIVIYDNNSPVFIIDDWNSSDNARTIVLEQLAYDIDHILTAEYRGNNKCSPSLSAAATVNIHDTNRVTSTLTISSGTQYNPNSTITKTLTLTNSASNPSYNQDQEIDIYYDGEYVSTVITLEDGTVDFTINSGDNGLHTIKAEYVGSEHLTGVSPTQTISVGYKIWATSYDTVQIVGVDNHFTARVTDCFDNPVYNTSVYLLNEIDSSVTNPVATDINGYANFVGYTALNFKFCTSIDSVQYNSPIYPITLFNPTSVELSVTPSQLYKSEESILTISLKGKSLDNAVPSSIPIHLYGSGIDETVYATELTYQKATPPYQEGNLQGIAYKTIVGTGKGDKSYGAEVGNISSQTLQVPDYLQFWQPNNNHNRKYFTGAGTFMDLNNLYRVTSNNLWAFALPMEDNKDYEFIIEGLSTSKNAYVSFLYNTIGNENGLIISNFDFTPTYVSHSNETWRMVRENGTVTVYKNNTLVNTYSNQGTYHPAFMYLANNTSTNFDFTKLTLREL